MPRVLVLRPGLSRCGWLLGSATVLAAFGAFMLYGGSGWPWLCLGLAAPLAGFGCWVLLAPRMRLRLSSAGFEYGTVARRYSFRWTDIAGFGVAEFATYQHVVFAFVPGYSGDEWVRRMNQDFGMFDRYLPDTYGYSAKALADLLELWRLHYTVRDEPLSRPSSTNKREDSATA